MPREGPAPPSTLAWGGRRPGDDPAPAVAAVARLLGSPGTDLEPLLTAAVAEGGCDAGCLLARAGDGWTPRAVAGVAPWEGPRALPLLAEGALADALAAGRALSAELAADDDLEPLPDGTRLVHLAPLCDRGRRVTGAVLLASRRARAEGEDALVLAQVVAARAAHVLEAGELEARALGAEAASRRAAGFRDQVLAIVGHDLRNPLGAIVMSTALLQRRGTLSGWQARTLDRMRSSTLRMGRIIDDLLSYTRTRLGNGVPIAPGPADLGEIAGRIVEELATAHPDAEVKLASAGDLAGWWDAARLEQVFSNLVSNAIDHGEEGAPVEVALDGSGEELRVEVANRGEMPPAVIEHAFEAFQRGPEATGRKASGLGLGLYIAREIVRRHGGEIAVASRDGMTRVDMRLPRRAAPPAA